MEFHELLSFGVVITLGILGGKASHRIKIPKVTGYMLVGLIFGPSVLGLMSQETLSDIRLINDITLGLLLFAIGGEIDFQKLRAMGRKVIYIAVGESIGAFILVFGVTLAVSRDFGLGLLLGSIAIATAPGVTLLVTREYDTKGELTDTLLSVVAINNVICLVVFRIFFASYSLMEGVAFLDVMFDLFKELVVSAIIGVGIGGLITYWEKKIDDMSELLLVIIGGLLLAIGLSKTLGISQLLVSMIIGAVTNNMSMMHRLVYPEMRQMEMPFFIAFFVLSGGSLHLGSLPMLGLLGVAYLLARPIGKIIGSYLTGRQYGASKPVRNYLGLALFPQAGVAIGMALVVTESHPEMGHVVETVVLSSIIIYEATGPFLTKLALSRAKEIRRY